VDTIATSDQAQGSESQEGSWLSVKQLQKELGIGPGLAYRLVNSGRIPSVRLHGLIRIHRPTMKRALLDNPPSGPYAVPRRGSLSIWTTRDGARHNECSD
jgi:hypothetical protein